MRILIDNREQCPLDFKIVGNVTQVIGTRLDVGDYACMMEPNSLNSVGHIPPIFFERKTIEDLFGTLTSGMERFKREIERSIVSKCKLYLIVEGTLSDVLAGSRFSQVNPDSIIKTVFTLKLKYDIHPIFCQDREEMKRYILETFESFGRNWKNAESPNPHTN